MRPSTGEFDLIARIRSRTPIGERVTLGIGDDCAAIRFTPGREVVVTTDMLMDGRHFRLGPATAQEIGYKSLAVNLSDIAAMAAVPVAAVVAVALPRGNAAEIARGIHEGMVPLAESFGVSLVGGDTNGWDGPLVVSVTVMGEASERGIVRRSGAAGRRRDPRHGHPGREPPGPSSATDPPRPRSFSTPRSRGDSRPDRPFRRAFFRPWPHPGRERRPWRGPGFGGDPDPPGCSPDGNRGWPEPARPCPERWRGFRALSRGTARLGPKVPGRHLPGFPRVSHRNDRFRVHHSASISRWSRATASARRI